MTKRPTKTVARCVSEGMLGQVRSPVEAENVFLVFSTFPKCPSDRFAQAFPRSRSGLLFILSRYLEFGWSSLR